jgi:hypothetical protein
LSEEEHEVTLHAERAVVDKEVVPVERVRLDTETVTSQETVTEDVRKEHIEHDGADQIDARGAPRHHQPGALIPAGHHPAQHHGARRTRTAHAVCRRGRNVPRSARARQGS